MGNVTVAVTPKKISEMFDVNGNQIDPVTKQIIKPAEVEKTEE